MQMTLDDIRLILMKHENVLREKYGVRHIKIFGSFVRGEQREGSDIDIIVEFERTPGLIKFVQLKEYLGDILGMEVDLQTEKSISPYIKPYIEEVPVL